MTAREIGPHTRPVYDLYVSRPRSVSARPDVVSGRLESHIHGERCTVRFYKADVVVYEEETTLISAGAAKAVYTAYHEALQSWRQRATYSPEELRRQKLSTNPDDWDEAEVNNKRFPRVHEEA